MSLFVKILGLNGIIFLIGLVTFLFSFKYSVEIFRWIENRTLGTRTYVMEKCELLFWEVKQDHVTYILLLISFGNAVVVFFVCGIFYGLWFFGFILGVSFGVFGWLFPRPFMDYMVNRRIKKYRDQMVDGLTLLANGIRAGLSVPQALGMVVAEMNPPISQEFNLLLQQNRVGVPLEECFENLAKRVPLEDNDMFVTSVNILRETGGNLSEVFETIVGVIRERVRLSQKIDTAVSAGLLQGYILFSMPFLILLIFNFMDPTLVKPLFSELGGVVVLLAAIIFDIIGLTVILKIVRIKV